MQDKAAASHRQRGLVLSGVDWAAVETFVDLRKKLGRFEPSSKGSEPDPE